MSRFFLFGLAFVFQCSVWAKNQAAIAMPDKFSSEVAENVLKQGGNAVDAAIAVAFSLAVTLPEAGNIGGGGFMLVQHKGRTNFLDYREVAPAGAHRDMYLDKNGNVVPNLSTVGALSAGVPGTVAGMWSAHQKYANLPWDKLIEPAIQLAEYGFIVPQHLANEKARVSKLLVNKPKVNFEKYFAGLKTGNLFKQPELAKTLKRIASQGPDGFYRGETADLIVSQMKRSGGLINHQDLLAYRAKWRAPLRQQWREFVVISSPPPSSGGTAVVQLLKMKQILAPQFKGVAHNSAKYIHLLAELEKRVYADRAKYMGDPDFVDVPFSQLLDDKYLAARAKQVNLSRISVTEKVKPGLQESPQTTHYSIVDQWGNAVSNTYTINLSFGSGMVVEGAGFLLNNEMDDFSAKPGVPNAFGVVGEKANEIAPKKRMLSSMSPTIITENGQVVAVVGTPGGSTIITSVFQTIVNLLDYAMTPQQAVDATRYHHQLLPKDVIFYNPKISQQLRGQLEDHGYQLKKRYLGDVQLVVNQNGELKAAADNRGRGESRVINWN